MGGVTKDPDYLKVKANNIISWPDFTYENIIAATQNALTSGGICLADVITERHTSPFEIENEDAMNDVIKQWNVAICREALKQGAQTVQKALGMVPHDITIRFHQKNAMLPTSTRPKSPDFSIFLKDDQKTVVVWGETKLSSKWNSDARHIHQSWKDNWIWPWRQILSYCVANNTRYGCLVTPEEFVALRIYRNGTDGETPYNIQFQSVPWDNQGQGKLTVNLCLWAMGMLALNEGHRPIVQKDDLLPINIWWKDRDPDGNTEYEHHLTGLRARKMPRCGEAKERPTRIREVDDMAEQSQRTKRSRRNR